MNHIEAQMISRWERRPVIYFDEKEGRMRIITDMAHLDEVMAMIAPVER